MLGFGSAQAAGLSELIAKKRYPKAIEVLREQLRRRGRDPRVRRQLADVLAMAGRPKEAVPILLELAEELALSGAAGKAIAILKRAQRLAPGQPEVEEQLAYLINQQKAPSPDPWAQARQADSAPPPPRFDDLGDGGGPAPAGSPAPLGRVRGSASDGGEGGVPAR
jgi:tetratricopeptide (TPR) repeat protein